MTTRVQRIDRWLWFARFLKTRTLAAKLVAAGRVRVNGERVSKPSHLLSPDDVLTFALGDRVRVVRVAAPGTRRGPFAEATLLYEDLSPSPKPAGESAGSSDSQASRPRGSGRPTKKQRRDLEGWLDGST